MAISAAVLPADTAACAAPSFTWLTATRMDESFFAPQSDFQRVVHAHHVAGRDDFGAGMGKLCQWVSQTDQKKLRVSPPVKEIAASRQCDTGPVIAPHAVDRDGGHTACISAKQGKFEKIRIKLGPNADALKGNPAKQKPEAT